MVDEQTHHFDIDVIGLNVGRTFRIQVERNHQLGSPRWRLFISEDVIVTVTNAELAEHLKQQTIELRRVADRLEDLAALMVTASGVVIQREPIVITPADAGPIVEFRP